MQEQLTTNELDYLRSLVELEVNLDRLIGHTTTILPDLREKLDRMNSTREQFTKSDLSHLHSLALRDARGRGLYKNTEVPWGRIVGLVAKLGRMHDTLETTGDHEVLEA
jgi:hypothetical protein